MTSPVVAYTPKARSTDQVSRKIITIAAMVITVTQLAQSALDAQTSAAQNGGGTKAQQ